MSMYAKPSQLKLFIAASGLLGLLLRFVLLQTAVDEKGLLVSGHWADAGSWLLTAAVIGCIFLLLRRCTGSTVYEEAFPASVLRCVGSMVAGCGFLLSGTSAVSTAKFAVLEPILKILAAAALIAVAYRRLQGKKPTFLLHGIVCLYLALRMVCRYQIWSSNPQLQHYAFYLGAHVTLLLSCYQLTAFDADSGNHQSLWRWCLGAVYLCLVALPGCEDAFFLFCCAFWMLTASTSLESGKGD